jgi:2-dehydropantoate 2-reductase
VNIIIVGPGAIGSLWACKLSLAGHNVSLWARQTEPNLTLQIGNHNEPLSFTNHDDDAVKQADLVIVTVKAWQVAPAIAPLLPLLCPDTVLLFIHNGMGALDGIADKLHYYPVVVGTTTHGALKTGGNRVHHTGIGTTQIGAFNATGSQCHFLVEVLQHALPTVSWHDNIQEALWLKLFINCAINPLTALYQCENGQLGEPLFRAKWQALLDEMMWVIEAEQLNYSRDDLHEIILGVINATSANRSSMHQDIANQRQTEIDYITGYLLNVGKRHQIELPLHQQLFDQIKEIEQKGLTQ